MKKLTLPNCTLKNVWDDKFYVSCILLQFKKFFEANQPGHYEKRKLQANLIHGHWRKNPKQNVSSNLQNAVIYKKVIHHD